jgi:tyrosinase
MGIAAADDPQNLVVFRPGHPLENWVTNGKSGISREIDFDVNEAPQLRTEAQTFALGGSGDIFAGFHRMEGDPHGLAHTSFTGPIDNPSTAVRDPLFFMLHCNIDRLWAKWQWVKRRVDPASPTSYSPPSPDRIGHHLGDTMWPWNGVITRPRPPTAPGGPFIDSGLTSAPGPTPQVREMFDHLAVMGGDPLGFAYEDVPFELLPMAVASGAGSGAPRRAGQGVGHQG